MVFEIRRSGVVLCSSSVPNLGYSREIIRDMERNGLLIYCDGKRVKIGAPSQRHLPEEGGVI